MSGSRKAKHDIAPMLRHAFIQGVAKVARSKGMTVPELMAGWIEEDWKAVLNAMGKYTVREANVTGQVEHDHKHEHRAVQDATRQLIDEITGRGEEGDDSVSRPH